jgi:hypothetical protein
MLVPYFELIFVFALVTIFVFRIIYRIIEGDHADSDAYGQLLQIREIRRANHRRPESPNFSAAAGKYAYPYLVIWVLSFVPSRFLEDVERYFSGIMDVLYTLLFLVLLRFDILSEAGVLLALAVFFATPQFMRPDLAHGYGLSSRKPGLLFATGSLFSFYQWASTEVYVWFAVAVLCGAAMVMASRFSLQAYVFILLPSAIFVDISAIPLLILVLLTAVVVSRGRYLLILKTHISHMYDYATELQYKNKFDHNLPNPIGFVKAVLFADSYRERLDEVRTATILGELVMNPFVIPVVVGLVLLENTAVPVGFSIWIASTLAAFVLTSLPHLLFLGQPERYLEYGFLPAVVLLSSGTFTLGPEYKLLIALTVVGGFVVELFLIYLFTNNLSKPTGSNDKQELISYLKSKQKGVVLAQPTIILANIAWETEHDVVDFFGGTPHTSEKATQQYNKIYPNTYCFVTNDLDWLQREFAPDWVVFDLEKTDGLEETDLSLPATSAIFENKRFKLYDFDTLYEE